MFFRITVARVDCATCLSYKYTLRRSSEVSAYTCCHRVICRTVIFTLFELIIISLYCSMRRN